MGAQNIVFHLIIESLAILASVYLFWLSFHIKQSTIHKTLLKFYAVANVLIDTYAIITWFTNGFLPKQLFHQITEALAIPAGIYIIWLALKQEKWYDKTLMLIMGIGNILVDGYLLFFTW